MFAPSPVSSWHLLLEGHGAGLQSRPTISSKPIVIKKAVPWSGELLLHADYLCVCRGWSAVLALA